MYSLSLAEGPCNTLLYSLTLSLYLVTWVNFLYDYASHSSHCLQLLFIVCPQIFTCVYLYFSSLYSPSPLCYLCAILAYILTISRR